jgi:biotin carboxyl carrier protein
MTFEVEIGGKSRQITIEPDGAVSSATGGVFRVKTSAVISSQSHEMTPEVLVSVRATDLGLSLRYESTGEIVDVAAIERASGEWLLQFPHVDVTAVVDRRRRESSGAGGVAASGAQRVNAPMPGRVVRVLVKPGDDVAVRQGLVVIEAMKMENELGSPKAGRVKEVAVAEGASVEAGRLLVVVE